METEIELRKTKAILERYAEDAERIIKMRLEDDDRKATGDLIKSIKVYVKDEFGTEWKVILQSRKYLMYLENGTKPHWPPVDALLKWVQKKDSILTREKTGDKSLPRERSLAYLVRRKISENGTKANKYVAETIAELNSIYMQKIKDALIEDITGQLPNIRLNLRFGQ